MFRRVMVFVVSGALALTGASAGLTTAQAAHVSAAAQESAVSTIVGKVVGRDGDPIPDVTVWATRTNDASTAASGADGRFEIEVAREGSYALSFDAPDVGGGITYDLSLKTPRVAAGARTDVGTVKLVPPASWGTSHIEVKISNLRAVGSGEEDPAYIYLKNNRGDYVKVDSVYQDIDTKRTAYFRDIAPGRYRVVVPATGQSLVITVGKGETAKRTLKLKKPAKRGNLVVKTARGLRVETFAVTNAAGLDISGQYASESHPVSDLPVGTYTVTAHRASGDVVTKVKVRAGRTTTAVLPLRFGGAVKVKVKAPSAAHSPLVILKGVGTGKRYEFRVPEKTGELVGRRIAPGRYRVIVRDVDEAGRKFTRGGAKDAYYKGKTLKKSTIITVKRGKTTKLSPITMK